MFNMIKLDWLGMKYYWVRIIIIPLSICIMGFFSEAIIIPLLSFFMLSFSVNPFAVEEKGKLDHLYLTLPVTRKTIVNARLGLSLIMLFAGIVFGVFLTILMSALLYGKTIIFEHTFQADFATMFLLICVSLLLYAIMNLSIFPILFKIGYAKGKALGFYIPVGVSMAVIYFFIFLWNYNNSIRGVLVSAFEWSLANTVWAALIILAASLIFFSISYALSQKVYSRREF
jgi:ABC-type transport system involved in multi-copper enzyme maturation permease subunit